MIEPGNPVYMTERGVEKAQSELETLLTYTRPEIVGYLQDAKDGGDAADNTEFLYLVQELENIDRRIRDLRYRVDRAQILSLIHISEPTRPTT